MGRNGGNVSGSSSDSKFGQIVIYVCGGVGALAGQWYFAAQGLRWGCYAGGFIGAALGFAVCKVFDVTYKILKRQGKG